MFVLPFPSQREQLHCLLRLAPRNHIERLRWMSSFFKFLHITQKKIMSSMTSRITDSFHQIVKVSADTKFIWQAHLDFLSSCKLCPSNDLYPSSVSENRGVGRTLTCLNCSRRRNEERASTRLGNSRNFQPGS